MDVQNHTVTRGKKQLILNRKEFALLKYLIRNAGMVLTRQMILERINEVPMGHLLLNYCVLTCRSSS
jgi:DNA-binding response OmpR family regulator